MPKQKLEKFDERSLNSAAEKIEVSRETILVPIALMGASFRASIPAHQTHIRISPKLVAAYGITKERIQSEYERQCGQKNWTANERKAAASLGIQLAAITA